MFFKKLFIFFFYLFQDIYLFIKSGKRPFREFGLTLYCGKQGAGKTMSMVEYLERIRHRYPKCLIYTNFNYTHQNGKITTWKDIVDIRNGTDGVVFAFDEIQNEFNSLDWQNFPDGLLREVTQQRKQRIKIVGTSQRFNRVVKQLREQCYTVVECFTLAGRWTFTKAFDADEYNCVLEQPTLKNKLHRLWRYNYIQTDKLRNCFDTYEKVQAMKDKVFVPQKERVS